MNSSLKGMHVLIVDDHPDVLKPLLSLIQAAGMRFSVVADPRQAVSRAQLLSPDLILLDVYMSSQMGGFAVCRLLKEAPVTSQIPVIFLTSASDVGQRLQGLALGGVDYVIKPFAPEEVLARIRVHLQRAVRSYRESAQLPVQDRELSSEQVILRAAMKLIESHLASPLSLADMAREIGTHEKTLAGTFRQHLGMSVFSFIREERLRKSQQLLASSNLSIRDIADLVGFRSAANFATAFRERIGVTPTAFRNASRKGE